MFPPTQIVCLTEETVETLYLLGEQDRIVGISGYVVRPPQARREKPRVSAFTSFLNFPLSSRLTGFSPYRGQHRIPLQRCAGTTVPGPNEAGFLERAYPGAGIGYRCSGALGQRFRARTRPVFSNEPIRAQVRSPSSRRGGYARSEAPTGSATGATRVGVFTLAFCPRRSSAPQLAVSGRSASPVLCSRRENSLGRCSRRVASAFDAAAFRSAVWMACCIITSYWCKSV